MFFDIHAAIARFLIITSAVFLSLPSAQAIVPITQAFTIASGTAPGSCDGQSNLLSNIWAECLVLTEAALDAINDFPTNTNIQELFYTFRSQDVLDDPNTQEDIDDIRGWFQDVQNFINGNGQVFAQGAAGEPLLYCDDTWLTKHAWTDDAEDANGLVTDQNPNSPTFGQTLSIQEVGVVRSNTYLTYWNKKPQPVPYWSGAPLNAYIFDSAYKNQGGSYCAAGNLAGTQDDTPRTTITLCPASFSTGPTTAHDTFLGESDPEVNDEVQDSSCLSLTLFHELFHAVEGKPNTPDATTRSGAAEAISLAANNDRRFLDNPETYTWFALTAWYYYNKNAWFRAGEDTVDN